MFDVLSYANSFSNHFMADYESCGLKDSAVDFDLSEHSALRYGVGNQPLRRTCKSDPQIPQHSTLISTSSSSNGLGSNFSHFIFPSLLFISVLKDPRIRMLTR